MITRPRQLKANSLLNLKHFTCLKLINPFLAKILCINLFSLAGIPPLSGFFSKLLILVSLLELNYTKLLLFTLIISVITVFYYIRIIKILLFTNEKQPKFLTEISYFSGILIVVTFYFNFFFFLQPFLFLRIVETIILPEFFYFYV
jgi:NADH-quinone oxidoreductase subunit N